MPTALTTEEINSVQHSDLSVLELENYRLRFKNGFGFVKLAGNCRLGIEIKDFTPEKRRELRESYTEKDSLKVLKFVPASGAASRMFRDLYNVKDSGTFSEEVTKFFDRIEDYPFGKQLLQKDALRTSEQLSDAEKHRMLRLLLDDGAMGYSSLPKGIIPFHKYPDGEVRTAFEEHFHEAAMYARTGDEVHIHFTIPAESQALVIAHLKEIADRLEKEHGLDYVITVSLQKLSTDTPAIYTLTGEWATMENGQPLRRPAGHGALIENLNELDADIIFIKNIDNVVPDRLKPATVEFKQLLAGVLLEVQQHLFSYLEDMDAEILDRPACDSYLKEWFHIDSRNWNETELRQFINRPLRVCGMVKNEGEPGGGPFVVDDGNGRISLQIVEKAQIDSHSADQLQIVQNASHFNPVDLVVATKNYKGEAFDLLTFRNENTGMIVDKDHEGRAIKAMELPGLWNGGMHHWNSIFVEVPIETFNPVKTVFDLMRPNHIA